MKEIIAITSLSFTLACASGSKPQSTNIDCLLDYDPLSNQSVYVFVDKMPEYEGGSMALLQFFANNFEYPKQEQFQATFIMEFIVDKKGKVTAPRIKGKDISKLTEAEKKVLDVLEQTSKWSAGSCNGKKVPVKMFLPLRF
ncbi:MAG: hypothetical protein J0M29_14980 [Chitinophagales bacterium]|nr:hypothetical protein [Chitinophagales bacterium]